MSAIRRLCGALTVVGILLATIKAEAGVIDVQNLAKTLATGASESLEGAYFGLRGLELLASSVAVDEPRVCKLVEASLSEDLTIEKAAWALRAAAGLSTCANLARQGEALPAAETLALRALERPVEVTQVMYALEILQARYSGTSLPKEVSTAVGAGVKAVGKLRASSGAFKACEEAAGASVAATGKAFAILALARSLGQDPSTSNAESDFKKLLARATVTDGLVLAEDDSPLEAAALLLQGAAALKLQGGQEAALAKMGTAVAAMLPAGSVREAYWAAAAATALTGPVLPAPPAATLLTPAVVMDGRMPAAVSVDVEMSTMAGGAPPPAVAIDSATAVPLERGGVDVAVAPSGAGAKWKLAFEPPVPGTYRLDLVLQPGRVAASEMVHVYDSRPIVKGAQVQLREAASGAVHESLSLTPSQPLPKRWTIDDTLEIAVTLEFGDATPPPQVMLMLTHAEGGSSAYFPAVGAGIQATSTGVVEQLGAVDGLYKASLVVAGPSTATPLSWTLGQVQVQHSEKEHERELARTKPNMDVRFDLKPEILHQHRPSASQPAAVVCMAFAALACLPLAWLLWGLRHLGANLKAMRELDAATALKATLFHSCIAAVLGLFAYYWLFAYSLAAIAVPLGVLAVATVFVGQQALSALADRRLRETAKKTE